jgi:hypothetical protein
MTPMSRLEFLWQTNNEILDACRSAKVSQSSLEL